MPRDYEVERVSPRRDDATEALSDTILPRLDVLEAKLDDVMRQTARASQRFFSVADAAAFAGLSRESIRRMLAAGKLTGLRPVRGKILLDRRELENVILASTAVPRRGRGSRTATRTSAAVNKATLNQTV